MWQFSEDFFGFSLRNFKKTHLFAIHTAKQPEKTQHALMKGKEVL